MAPANTVEMQPQRAEAGMVASTEAQQNNAVAAEQQQAMTEAKKPILKMRGGGLILDLCACFICCEACQACCEAVDDCCCC